MKALAEPIVWVIRVGSEHHKFGDPWEFCVTCTYNGEGAWLHAGQGTMTPSIMKAVGAELARLGFDAVTWERVGDDGEFKAVTHKIPAQVRGDLTGER